MNKEGVPAGADGFVDNAVNQVRAVKRCVFGWRGLMWCGDRSSISSLEVVYCTTVTSRNGKLHEPSYLVLLSRKPLPQEPHSKVQSRD